MDQDIDKSEELPEEVVEETTMDDENLDTEEISSENSEVDSEETESDELETLRSEIKQLQEENSELKNQYLRKQADFENYRKRMTREKSETVKYGNKSLLEDMVEIIDNFERAIKSSQESKEFETFYEGIAMIEQQMTSMLSSKYGLTKMVATGELYDPNLHEAMFMEESDEVTEPTVLEDFQTGYMLYERVLKPAKVKVGKPAVSASETESESAEEAQE